jgi:putative copper export protein
VRRLADAVYGIAVSLWAGGLWAVGYLAAPTLFAQLPDNRALAGQLAGHMFTWMAWVGIGCAAYLLLFVLARRGWRMFSSPVFWLVLTMLLLTLAGHFGIQPILAELKAEAWPREVMQSVVRDRFAAWHGVSSVLYLLVSGLGLALVVVQERGRT